MCLWRVKCEDNGFFFLKKENFEWVLCQVKPFLQYFAYHIFFYYTKDAHKHIYI